MNEKDKNNLPLGDDNSSPDTESIDEILKSFQREKEIRKANPDSISMPDAPVRSERQLIDFTADTDDKAEEKPAKKQTRIKKERKKINIKKLAKPIIIAVALTAVIAGAIFGVKFAVTQSRVAYLKPYQQKYPDAQFPQGILEKYCDTFGENEGTVGYIKINELSFESAVIEKKKDIYPMAEEVATGAQQNNFVVYLDNNKLEEYYKDADSYNEKASGFIQYSDLFCDYNFKVIGAFYTNTKADDDAGYIFPYNVTEALTEKSSAAFIDRLQTRFMYDTGVTITRGDRLLTVSCPTDYRKDFRFVVVGVMRDDNEKLTAKNKQMIRYAQVIYDEQGKQNPYRFASKWYPEIVITKDDGTTRTYQQSIKHYKQK